MPLKDEHDSLIIPSVAGDELGISGNASPRTVFAALNAYDERKVREQEERQRRILQRINPSSAGPASEGTISPLPPPKKKPRLRILPDSRAPWDIEEWEKAGKPRDLFTKRGFKVVPEGSIVKGNESAEWLHESQREKLEEAILALETSLNKAIRSGVFEDEVEDILTKFLGLTEQASLVIAPDDKGEDSERGVKEEDAAMNRSTQNVDNDAESSSDDPTSSFSDSGDSTNVTRRERTLREATVMTTPSPGPPGCCVSRRRKAPTKRVQFDRSVQKLKPRERRP